MTWGRLHIFKNLLIAATALFCCACTGFINDFSEKIIPERAEAEIARLNEAVINKDVEAVFANPHESLKDVLTEEKKAELGKYMGAGEIISRTYFSSNVNSSISAGEGKKKTYEVQLELETDQGFIVLTYGLLDGETCCEIYNFNINRGDTSFNPMADFDPRVVIAVLLGVLFLIGLIIFLIVRANRKPRNLV